MNGLVYFLERQFSREDIMHWRRKSFNPGILVRMMERVGYEHGHLVPRRFQLDSVCHLCLARHHTSSLREAVQNSFFLKLQNLSSH